MIDRQKRLLLAVSAGLCVALAVQSAMAALVVGEQSPFGGAACGRILQSITSELTTSGMAAAATFAGPSPAHSQDEENNRRAFQIAQGLLPVPVSGCQSNSISQSSGSGWSGATLVNTIWDTPPLGPETSLPNELKIILPIPPPFDLLRPV